MTLNGEIPFDPGEGPVAQPGVKRRDFLFIATGAFAGIGTLFMAWPFIDQINPAADVLAAGAPIDIDLSKILPGQRDIVIVWQSKPVFIVHRTPAILAKLKSQAVLSRLRDPPVRDPSTAPLREQLVPVGSNQTISCWWGYARTWAASQNSIRKPARPLWVPIGPAVISVRATARATIWRAACSKGVPAPLNLPVPPYHFANDTTLVIGENPKGQTFDLGSVEQL